MGMSSLDDNKPLTRWCLVKPIEERRNRFNGESVMLTKEEARRHDNIFILMN